MITYKKIVVSEPYKVEVVKDVMDEAGIAEKEILVKKHYSLVSAGTESACITGKEIWFPLPGVLGYSAVGEVVATGAEVENCKKGDLIYFQGKHSEYEVIKEGELMVKVPDTVKQEYIPFIRMAAISSSAIWTSDIELGDDVLIAGQGLIGLMAMQLARLQGARVIAVDTSDKRLAIAKKLGADAVLNPMKCDMEEEIKTLTGGRMARTLIDATGNSQVICENLKYVIRGGEAILLGSPRTPYESDVTQIFQYIHQFRFQIDIKGAHEMRYPARKAAYVKHSAERTLEILIDLIASGRFHVDEMLTQIVKPEEAAVIYQKLAEKDEDYLGIIYDWNE